LAFDKHGWLKAIQADPNFTDREFRLAFVVCNQFTRRDGTGWPVELDRIAEAITGGFNAVKLRQGLLKLCREGYLIEKYRRSTGPGLTAQRAHDLLPQNTDTVEGSVFRRKQEHRYRGVRTPQPYGANTDTERYEHRYRGVFGHIP
jgi:hypothetical protein